MIATFCWVQLCFLIGGLNQIAQLCSVLFLLSYASVNLACLGLDLASAPNFRPTFAYFSWHTSLVGLVGTATMMFLISPLFAAVSILLCLSLILSLNLFSPLRNTNWGSISQALIFHQVTLTVQTLMIFPLCIILRSGSTCCCWTLGSPMSSSGDHKCCFWSEIPAPRVP